ncbi:MAG: DUF4242 domain-containing protein [Minwuia sp.]|uniref:DUF4242 domain-containing protein n=1 Tax=Minwuia sp. TaxID=2493630 RepID=UPI003A85BFF3
MKRYVIERDIPEIGAMNDDEAKEGARTSNAALAQLAPNIQWQHSYVVGDKTFCVYLAEDEEVIRRHSELSGFPITNIFEIRRTMDPASIGGRM